MARATFLHRAVLINSVEYSFVNVDGKTADNACSEKPVLYCYHSQKESFFVWMDHRAIFEAVKYYLLL